MRPFFILVGGVALCNAANSAANLYVAGTQNITSLTLTEEETEDDRWYTLKRTHQNDGCAPSPSWLTLDKENDVLYCFVDTQNVSSSISTYKVAEDGNLQKVDQEATLNGSVSGTLYGDKDDRFLVSAQYHSHAVTTFNTTSSGNLTQEQEFVFTQPAPGPNPRRQEAPHPHQTVADPTGNFVLVPDLGADLVRVFAVDAATNNLTEKTPLQAAAGSGPRHLAFWSADDNKSGNSTYMFVVAELANTVTGYRVSYPPGSGEMEFAQVSRQNTLGNNTTPAGSAAAEIQVSPDNKFIIVSTRYDASWKWTTTKSDSLATFKPWANGTLEFKQLAPAGGTGPRHFSLNKAGDLVAVTLQNDGRVAILRRRIKHGQIMGVVARIDGVPQAQCVVWDE